MASTLKVDNIIATDGTTAPITLSGDTATLGSAVSFPSEFPTFIKVFDATGGGTINSGATNNTTGINFGVSMSFTFPANSTAVITSVGGAVYGYSGALYLSHTGHAYKSGTDFSSSTDGSFLWSGYARNDGALTNSPGAASTILTNTGSEATYYIRLAIRTHNSGFNARWDSVTDISSQTVKPKIPTTIMVYKT